MVPQVSGLVAPPHGPHDILDAVSRRRLLCAVIAAALAVPTLAACRSDIGVAARVDGTRITESDVNQYLSAGGVDKTLAAQAKANQQTISPRTLVLSVLIQEQVFAKTLRRQKINVESGDLSALHDRAGSGILQADIGGAALDSKLEELVAHYGIKRNFRAKLLRTTELRLLLIEKAKIDSDSRYVALLKPVASRVTVSPRYGTWDVQSLDLTGKPTLPSFVSEQKAGS
jgi:hypothetical protein